jgi:hypothetical protein
MARLELAIEIAATPNVVFAFFVPQRMPYWCGAEMQARFEVQGGAGEFQTGQKVRITGRLARREVAQTVVLSRYDWGRTLEWRFEDAYGIRGLQRWEIEPAESGTHVRMRDEYEVPGRFGRILDWLLTRHSVARRDREWLARLQRLAERR